MKNKNAFLSLKRDYLKLPAKLVSIKAPLEVLGLYLYLSSHKEDYFPSQSQIAYDTGTSITRVKKYLRVLVEHRMIRKINYVNFKTIQKYEFTSPSEWVAFDEVSKDLSLSNSSTDIKT